MFIVVVIENNFSYKAPDKTDKDCKDKGYDNCPSEIQGDEGDDGEPGGRGGNAGNPGRETTEIQWSADITMYQGSGEITSLYRGIVINQSPV